MSDKEYFSHLYEIASHLNKEFSLHAALRKALEKTVDLLGLETGWVWLVQEDVKSVYLAASYNLPPALSNHPERLSGWCFCIQKYLSDKIEKATNISEIRCTRLKDIAAGTRDLKFHATIPITIGGLKVGLMNLVSKETQQLDDKQLSILNTISELMGIAIQRTRLQESYASGHSPLQEILERVLQPRIDTLISDLNSSRSLVEQNSSRQALEVIRAALARLEEMREQLSIITKDAHDQATENASDNNIQYPASPLTNRELEVLNLVRKGHTNQQIAEQLFISERTVKFHITSLLSKLFAKTRTEAVDTALRRGLLGS